MLKALVCMGLFMDGRLPGVQCDPGKPQGRKRVRQRSRWSSSRKPINSIEPRGCGKRLSGK